MFTYLINISSTKDYKLFVFPVFNTSSLLNAAAGAFFMQNQSFCRVDKTGSVVLLAEAACLLYADTVPDWWHTNDIKANTPQRLLHTFLIKHVHVPGNEKK